jgi:RNA polymerase sigma-70 factor (ECF subfamily)
MDEKALIRAARKGDLDAFNRLVLAYQSSLYNHAYRMLGEKEGAADATQEAFIKAYTHIRGYRGESFRGWLYRIVTNVCYDEMRRRQQHSVASMEPLDDTGEVVESPHWIVDPSPQPEEEIERTQVEEVIQHCLDKLSPDSRTVVVLVDVQGWNYSEAASVIHKPVGTVRSRLSRARLQLHECLQGFMELLPSNLRQKREV